jgi:signal transduction histidine kinase
MHILFVGLMALFMHFEILGFRPDGGDWRRLALFLPAGLLMVAFVGAGRASFVASRELYRSQQKLISELDKAKHELEDALSIRDEFLELISHELRTPLTVIVGNSQVLESERSVLTDSERRAAASDIAQEAADFNRLSRAS